jgi:hypothetical protein
MNKYLTVKRETENDTAYKNIRIVQGSWEPVVVRPGQPARKWDGSLSMPIGGNYRVWRGVAKVYATDGAPFWTYSTLEALLTSTSLTDCNLVLRDFEHGTTPYKVAFVGDWNPKNQVPVIDGTGSFWLIPVQFEFRSA